MSDKICCATSPCDWYVTFNIPEILVIYTAILCLSWVLKKLSIFPKLVIRWTTSSVRFCFIRTDRICFGLVEHSKLPVWMTDWIVFGNSDPKSWLHAYELPLMCWINPIYTSISVTAKLHRRCFCCCYDMNILQSWRNRLVMLSYFRPRDHETYLDLSQNFNLL
jgi:hypothetical protein